MRICLECGAKTHDMVCPQGCPDPIRPRGPALTVDERVIPTHCISCDLKIPQPPELRSNLALCNGCYEKRRLTARSME